MLQLNHISFFFFPGKPILKDISMSLEQGHIYALMGSNGAGKTTMFNLISGFIKPQSGDIFFKEKNITRQQPYRISRQGIGRTFQDLRLITKLSVKNNVVLSMRQNPTDNWLSAMLPEVFHRNINATLEKRANEILDQFFLNGIQNSLAAEISYGQLKLLSLACCVANGATTLLLDEPVAGIQPEYRSKIATLIKQLKKEGKTILLIEHNTDFIAEVAEQIFFLHEGEISTFKNMETLKKDPRVMEAYI